MHGDTPTDSDEVFADFFRHNPVAAIRTIEGKDAVLKCIDTAYTDGVQARTLLQMSQNTGWAVECLHHLISVMVGREEQQTLVDAMLELGTTWFHESDISAPQLVKYGHDGMEVLDGLLRRGGAVIHTPNNPIFRSQRSRRNAVAIYWSWRVRPFIMGRQWQHAVDGILSAERGFKLGDHDTASWQAAPATLDTLILDLYEAMQHTGIELGEIPTKATKVELVWCPHSGEEVLKGAKLVQRVYAQPPLHLETWDVPTGRFMPAGVMLMRISLHLAKQRKNL